MKKLYTLIALAGLSASLSAQSVDLSNRPYIGKTIPYTHVQNMDRMSYPDTTGIVNYTDFLPGFMSMSMGAVLYSYTQGGFLYGNNADSINVCAQGYMNLYPIPVRVMGVLVWFGAKQSDAGGSPGSKVVIKSWEVSANKALNTDGSGVFNMTVFNSPGPSTANNAPDASADLLFSDIDTLNNFNYVSFANPPSYVGDFAVGVDLTTLAAGDTVGLVSDSQYDAGNLDYAYHFYQNKWFVTDQLFSPVGSPYLGSGGLDNNIAIWAVIDTAQCVSHYTTVYDSTLNTFNLTIAPATTALATGYHWDFGDGNTSNIINPTHVYAVDSLYNVCLKTYNAVGDSCEYCHTIGLDSLGNVSRTGGFSLHVIAPGGTVSVGDIASENTISISPNPFNSETRINFSKDQNNTLIILTDILGKQIRSVTFSGKQYILEKGELKPGIYFVKTIDAEKHVCNKQLIIQ